MFNVNCAFQKFVICYRDRKCYSFQILFSKITSLHCFHICKHQILLLYVLCPMLYVCICTYNIEAITWASSFLLSAVHDCKCKSLGLWPVMAAVINEFLLKSRHPVILTLMIHAIIWVWRLVPLPFIMVKSHIIIWITIFTNRGYRRASFAQGWIVGSEGRPLVGSLFVWEG